MVIFKSVEQIERIYLPNKCKEDEEKRIYEMSPEELNKHFGQKLKQDLKLIGIEKKLQN